MTERGDQQGGLGIIQWWGLSPALDMTTKVLNPDVELDILLCGSGDVRHILQTVSRLGRQKTVKKINFYLWEPQGLVNFTCTYVYKHVHYMYVICSLMNDQILDQSKVGNLRAPMPDAIGHYRAQLCLYCPIKSRVVSGHSREFAHSTSDWRLHNAKIVGFIRNDHRFQLCKR